MNDCGSIIPGVDPLQRIGNDRTAQIPLGIAAGNALVYCFCQRTSGEVYVLTNVKKNYGHAGVLTNRKLFFFGGFDVSDQVRQNLPSGWGLLRFRRAAYAVRKGLGQKPVSLYAKVSDGVFYFGHVYFAHNDSSSVFIRHDR